MFAPRGVRCERWGTRRFSRRSVTTIRSWKRCRLRSSDWKEERHSMSRMPGTKFQESFEFHLDTASQTAPTPARKSSDVTESLHVGLLVAVRGFEPRSRG